MSYRALKRQFALDDELLADLTAGTRCARYPIVEDDGQGLVWTRETAPPIGAHPPLPRPEAEPPHAPTGHRPTRMHQTAERRQLTVLFCDLVGSTMLSGQLDPEDLRAVVRAYQEAAAEVIQRYEGHIAQYLGDGLLVYFGYPQAHEDDAAAGRAHGLGIVEAIATPEYPSGGQYGVQLAVRLGIHTGPVVVGEIGGGGGTSNWPWAKRPTLRPAWKAWPRRTRW